MNSAPSQGTLFLVTVKINVKRNQLSMKGFYSSTLSQIKYVNVQSRGYIEPPGDLQGGFRY
jgi:hypothetical protein